MRATKARRLRAKVYGDGSRRNLGEYVYSQHKGVETGALECTGLRYLYLEAKKEARRANY